jgi:beta-phosphoglucomutase
MALKAAIFDLDGVIVDTAKYHYLAWRRLAAELGFEFEACDNERLKGVSRMKSLDILLEVGNLYERFPEGEKVKLAEQKNEWYLEYIRKMDRNEILPGALEYLTRLRMKGIKTGLGTASKNSGLILENLGLKDLFNVVVDGTRVVNAKPDPEVFLKCSCELQVEPQLCAVFEDSAAGIEAARLGGMTAVGVGNPAVEQLSDFYIRGLDEYRKLAIF